MADEYRKLVAIIRTVLRQGQTVARRLADRNRRNTDATRVGLQLEHAFKEIRRIRPLLERVVNQTTQRLFGGDTHVSDKVLSLFEPHTEAIRKGKMAKPTEFGKMVAIQEAEGGLVTGYVVHPKRAADDKGWDPALENHLSIFGKAPYLAAAERGVSSHRNEVAGSPAGVHCVCLPAKGRLLSAQTGGSTTALVSRGTTVADRIGGQD